MQLCPSCGRETPEGFPRCANCGAELTAEPGRQERKIVTVLFCDLVGFTSRAETMDPEDVRALLEPYHAHVRSELERFGGTVEKFIGDAVMAVFGAPIAHEDDPERAVRAALAIRDWAQEEALELRIGVNTGEALVTIGGEPLAAGDVVNTAARLQAAAPTSGVLAGETTFRATRDVIDYHQSDAVAAKGKSDPVPVWEALHARALVTVERSHAATLVGRGRELALLHEALARAREERSAQLVTLVGVPGIGKSRLVYELFRSIEAGEKLVSWRRGRCLPYGEGVTFWALGEIVKAQAGILESDPPDDVERKLREAAADPWIASHLRPLVGLPADATAVGDRRVESFAAWRQFLETLAEERPLALVFEDLHWADDGLLDFVDHLVDRAAGVALLVVCTARPELLERRPAWGGGKPNAITTSLSPLSDEDTARLLGDLLERPVLPAETQADLLARAGGNPLYAEQYARMLAERGDAGTVPETVQGIVAARLDLLEPEEKGLLQEAAVLGRTLWAGALGAMLGLDRLLVEERLHPLERKDFLRRERRSAVSGDTQYTFLHLLVRDVTYGQIPRGDRAEKHLRAAGWIESLGRPEDHGDLLAHHYLAALDLSAAAGRELPELATRAAQALGEAGDRAVALNAYSAAEGFYRRALDLTPAGNVGRPGLLLRYSRALYGVMGGEGDELVAEGVDALLSAGDVEGAAEAELVLAGRAWERGEGELASLHLDRARSLLTDAPVSAAKTRVLSETARYAALAGRDEEAVVAGLEALAMAEQLELDALRAYTLLYVGMARVALGRDGGFRDMEESIDLLAALNSPEAARAYNNLGAILVSIGEASRGAEVWRRGIAATTQFAHGSRYEWLHLSGTITPSFLEGDWDDVMRIANDVLARPVSYFHFWAYDGRARVRLARGDMPGALADAAAALELGRASKDPQSVVPGLSIAAATLLAAERRRQAVELVEELLAQDALRAPVAHWASPWSDFSWTLVDLGRTDDLLAAIGRVRLRTRWVEAAEAIAEGEYLVAAAVYADVGNQPAEAYTRLRAAQAGLPGPGLDRAVSFFRKAGATVYLAAAEELAAASA